MLDTTKIHSAVVARAPVRAKGTEEYLVMTTKGTVWTSDEMAATHFSSVREANRMAVRLASAERAFGLPVSTHLN